MTAYLETFQDMRDSFADYVGEAEATDSKWSNDTRVRMLNESQLKIVTLTKCLEERWDTSKGIWAAAGDEIVTLSNEMYPDGLIAVWWLDSSSVYHKLTEDLVGDAIQNSDTGTPTKFFRINNNLYLKPKQDAAGTAVIVGERLPDELVNPTDQSLIAAAHRHTVPLDAAIRALVNDEQFQKAGFLKADFNDRFKALQIMATGRHRKTRQPSMKLPTRLSAR
jgi:hypothetical protein